MHTYRLLCVICATIALLLYALAPNRATAQQTTSSAAPDRQAQRAQLAVPFGVVEGQLVISGPYLIFIDGQQPAASFVIPRDDVRNTTANGAELALDLTRPVQDSGGVTNRLVFRLASPDAGQPYSQWFHQPAATTGEANRTPEPASPASASGTLSFQVKHDHFIGSDMGRLLIAPAEIAYESVTNVKNSRRWNFSDIKEVHQDGPYKLKITPFSGDEYSFEMLGQGMTPDQYQMLVDRITRARALRH